MIRWPLWIGALFFGITASSMAAPQTFVPLEQRPWFETRTAHFNIYSCGDKREVFKLAGRLEQFCKAYSQLAGTDAVDSPPIVVMAFPNRQSLKPFLPLYQGKPSNIAAFFERGSDENLIVLSLPEPGSPYMGMEVIFHEYAHLLFRRNDLFWPMWLKEGMAEIYSTFETDGHAVRIARPIPYHLQTLQHEQFMSLPELFSVTHDSPQYNERERQGGFYAESWLLTHFLMNGDNGQYRSRFGQFTSLLRQGQFPVSAFTNAMQMSFPATEAALRQYLARGVFPPIDLLLTADISKPINLTTRFLAPVEINFRLGDELMKVNQSEAAEVRFEVAKQLAPANPLPYEGLGLLAHAHGQRESALRYLKSSIQFGSTSYQAYYLCALEEFRGTADGDDRYSRIEKVLATEIRDNLTQSITLMPSFGPAQQLLGTFEMVQGEHLAEAGTHLQLAVQLEPENPSYVMSLAQYQHFIHNSAAARQTLQPLLLPNTNARFRLEAEKLMKEIDQN